MRVIAGSKRGRMLKTLPGERTRPTTGKVREAVFSSLQVYIKDNVWLDLFAGSGAMGIEALSRGAAFCWFVDNYPLACKTVQSNLKNLTIPPESWAVLCTDATLACRKIAREQGRCVDVAFLDPPYARTEIYLAAISCVEHVLVPGGFLILEHDSRYVPEVHYAEHLRTRHYGFSSVSFYRNGGE